MDLGYVFNLVAPLYNALWNSGFSIFGIYFTWGDIVVYGLFISVVIAFVNALRS